MYTNSSLKTFIVDIDGVACEHAKAICKWVNEQYGLNSKVEDVTTWDHDFGPISFVKAVEVCYPNEEFILGLEVTPGFLDFMERIKTMVSVKFVSSRKYSHKASRLWIAKNFGEIETVFVQSKKDIFFDYLLDDNPEEVIEAAMQGLTSFLFNRPWNNNQKVKTELAKHECAHFVDSFAEVICYLKENLEKDD